MGAKRSIVGVIVLVLIQALVGCDASRLPSAPAALSPLLQPSPVPPPQVIVFTDRDSGISTSDARDVDGQIVQFNTANELIWIASGTRLPGYRPDGLSITAAAVCEHCSFEVRFGTANGERRAYLTMNYHHDNPGTVIDLEVVDGKLVATRTNRYVPGTFTLSGLAFEATAAGRLPVADISLHIPPLDLYAGSDKNGFYSIQGLNAGVVSVWTGKDGYEGRSREVKIDGNTRFDIQMVRRSMATR